MGGQFNFALNPADAAQAGTAGDKGKYSADAGRLTNDINAAKADYENKFNTQKVSGIPAFENLTLSQMLPQISESWNTQMRPQMQAALDQINALRGQHGLGSISINPANGQPIYLPNQTISGQGLQH